MAIIKEIYPVVGMECASCVKKIESILGKTDGILNATANFASEKIAVEYDNEKIGLDKIADILKKIGYELVT